MTERSRSEAERRAAALDDTALVKAVEAGGKLRGAALFELIDRAKSQPHLVPRLGELARFPPLREDRLFRLVSAAWAAIIGLLSIETEQSRQLGYAAFEDLDGQDRTALLAYLKVDRIEDSHPSI